MEAISTLTSFFFCVMLVVLIIKAWKWIDAKFDPFGDHRSEDEKFSDWCFYNGFWGYISPEKEKVLRKMYNKRND